MSVFAQTPLYRPAVLKFAGSDLRARLLSPEQIAWCAGTGRFLFHKDTCCHPGQIAAKIAAIPEGSTFRFYNANAATVQFSMRKGGAGFSGINANFYPQLVAWLVENSDHPRATALQQYLAVAENVVMYKYPQSAKAFLAQYDSFSAEAGRVSGMGLKCRKGISLPVFWPWLPGRCVRRPRSYLGTLSTCSRRISRNPLRIDATSDLRCVPAHRRRRCPRCAERGRTN